jgi:beta-lactam-binding protein with PASTA domain
MIAEQRAEETESLTTTTVTIPEVTGMNIDDAKAVLAKKGFQTKIFGSGDEVIRQYPTAGTKAERGAAVQVMMNETEQPFYSNAVRVPELRGMSVRRAVNKLAAEHLSVTIIGSGNVVNQFPSAGTGMKTNGKVTLMCEPKQIVTAQLY